MKQIRSAKRFQRMAWAAAWGLGLLPALAYSQSTPTTAPANQPTLTPTVQQSSSVPADPYLVANSSIIGTDSFSRRVTILPHGLLWQPPLASPNEPRCYMKIMSLEESDMPSVNDCNIGGTLPLVRVSRLDKPNEGVQTDIFATVMSRFVDRRTFAAVDYRFGVPFTLAEGPWSFKIAYEHTSCHLGDEFLIKHNLPSRDSTRNEAVFGISYRPIEPLRLYGQFGYAVGQSSFVENIHKERYTCGAEWSKPGPTGDFGQPYAAIDVEFRGDEDYTPNLTAQIGWQWLGLQGAPGYRFAVEYYDGRSPFGQFIDRHESWVALGFYFDF